MVDDLGLGRAARMADFAQYVKDKKAADDKAWAADQERTRLLDESDRKYNEQMAADLKIAEEKRMKDALPVVGQTSDGSSGPATGIDMFFDAAKARELAADALKYRTQHAGAF